MASKLFVQLSGGIAHDLHICQAARTSILTFPPRISRLTNVSLHVKLREMLLQILGGSGELRQLPFR